MPVPRFQNTGDQGTGIEVMCKNELSSMVSDNGAHANA